MASPQDLRTHATSTYDFYTLLSLPHSFSTQELSRAWRKTALKYHPDKLDHSKLSPTEAAAAAEKFHLAQVGFDLLSDPSLKQLYDSTRNARLQKEREKELYGKERRKKVEDLERRESGGFEAFKGGNAARVKREREEDELDKLERELRRLAQDGKRRRLEREETLREEIQREKEEAARGSTNTEVQEEILTPQPTVSELDRTIKARFPFPPPSQQDITQKSLQNLFSRFGQVDSVALLQPKLAKLSTGKKKQNTVTAMVTFMSVVGAHAAVEDFPSLKQKLTATNGFKQEDLDWRDVDSVSWATNQAPEFLSNLSPRNHSTSPPLSSQTTTPNTPVRPPKSTTASSFLNSARFTPTSDFQKPNGVRKVPSFTSFTSTPKTFTPSKASTPSAVSSPSLEELTMIRLKNAEKERMRRELEKKDREEDERQWRTSGESPTRKPREA